MNNLQIFNSAEFGEIRTVVKDNEPMFCLADVCKALELTNSRIVAERLEEDERCKFDLPRQGETWFITESGLYAVILRSDKPNARNNVPRKRYEEACEYARTWKPCHNTMMLINNCNAQMNIE